jgi:hypothetical protein
MGESGVVKNRLFLPMTVSRDDQPPVAQRYSALPGCLSAHPPADERRLR